MHAACMHACSARALTNGGDPLLSRLSLSLAAHRVDTTKPIVGHSAQRAHGTLGSDGGANIVNGARYISLATGPQNYAVGYVTTIERLSTFWLTVALGITNEIHFSSTTPKRLRLHLRDASHGEHTVVQVPHCSP